MRTKHLAILCAAVLCPAACSDSGPGDEVASPEAGAPENSLLPAMPAGTVKTREYIITLLVQDKEILYTVADLEGNILFERVSKSELEKKAPEVLAEIERGIPDDRWAAPPPTSPPAPPSSKPPSAL